MCVERLAVLLEGWHSRRTHSDGILRSMTEHIMTLHDMEEHDSYTTFAG